MVRIADPANAIGAGIGILADRLLGDPPHRFDPIKAIEQLTSRGQIAPATADGIATAKATGLAYFALGTLGSSAAGWGLKRITGGLASASITAWVAIRGRSRGRVAIAVGEALEAGEADRARQLMPSMIREEAATVPDHELAGLMVAAVAEQAIDGIVGPALWAAVAGAPGTLVYRGINGLDAAVGYHSQRANALGPLGPAVDVAANLVPACVGAALVAVARPNRAGPVWQATRHPSRHLRAGAVGVIEAAFAAALGLDGREADARRAEPADIGSAVVLARDVSLALAGLCLALGGAAAITARWRSASSVH